MLLSSAVHVSSTIEFGAVFHDFLSADPQGNPPFFPFAELHECYCLALFMCPPLSRAKSLVTGKHVILLFSGSDPLPNYVYMCVCILCSLFLWVFVFCFVQKKKRRSRDESRHHGKGRTDEISVLSLLSSYSSYLR